MKLLYTLILTIFCGGSLFAQVGIGTNTPNINAVLELNSPGNNQGLLVPRLTTAQRIAINLGSTDNGLMVYDSEDQKFYYWQSTQWLPIRSGIDVPLEAGTGIDITGNTISAVPDADGDATNEIQDLQLIGGTLTISNNADATAIDLAPFLGVNTDNQTLSYEAGVLGITGGNTVTVTPSGPAGGILSGSFPDPAFGTGAGNDLLAVLNNASTTSTLQANRLDANVVLQSESPAGGVISGSFGSGLQIVDDAVSEAMILDRAVTDTKLSTTGVLAGTYGSSASIPRLTVDAQGRITAATTAAVPGTSVEGLAETLAADNDAKAQAAVNLSAVSINTTATTGALNVIGSHFVSFTMFDDGYRVQPEDYILIANPDKPANIYLPEAAKNKGRILIIRSQSSGDPNTAVIVNADAADLIDGATTSEPLYIDSNFSNNAAYSITIISTGATWLTIDRGLPPAINKGN